MPRVKVTTMSKVFNTYTLDVTDKQLAEMADDREKALETAIVALGEGGYYDFNFVDDEDDEVVFVDYIDEEGNYVSTLYE